MIVRKPTSDECVGSERNDDHQRGRARSKTESREAAPPLRLAQLHVTARPAHPSPGNVDAQRDQEPVDDHAAEDVAHECILRLATLLVHVT